MIAPAVDRLPRGARFLRTGPFAAVRGVSLRCAAALALATLVGAGGCGSKQSSAGGGGGNDPSDDPVSVPAGSPITLSGRATDGTVSGTYEDPLTQLSFSFSVRATGDDSAVASYTLHTDYGDSLSFQVSLSGRSSAVIVMPDLEASITGMGPRPEDFGAQMLLAWLDGIFGPAIRAIPLELNCGAGFAPAEIAALLVPWQVVYKYELGPGTRYGDVRSAAEAATCTTFPFAGASPTQLPPPSTKRAGSGLINLGNDDNLPTVFGFFPLDAVGSKEDDVSAAVGPFAVGTEYEVCSSACGAAASLINTTRGPCESMCRGACGADCEPNNCRSATGLSQCEVDPSGANTCFKLVYTDYVCGTHPACIAHDDCYDECNRTHNCGSFEASLCMHAMGHSVPFFVSCDQRVIDHYGLSQGLSWAMGDGPFTDSQTYRYVSSREWDDSTCPCIRECVPGGTLVTLADGRSRPIEQFAQGDALATVGPSGDLTSALVEEVFVHRDGPYVLDRIESSGGHELLVTPNHPVWTVERGYVPASDLVVGAHVLVLDPASGAAHAETLVSIVREFATTDVVYNLKTSRSSYVAAGILVHNKCLARGSLVDTPEGPVAIEELRPGDLVLGQVDGRRVATRVLRTYDKSTILGRLPGRRLAPHLLVTDNHQVVTPDGDKEASLLSVPAEDVVGVVYDLETESGNYWAQGALLRAASSSAPR